MKKILALILVLVLAAAFFGCGETNKPDPSKDPNAVVDPEPEKDPEPALKAVGFKLEIFNNTSSEFPTQKGVLTGTDKDGKELFSIETADYDITELEKIQGAGLVGDNYYLICGGEIWCIGTVEENCGKILWKNKDFMGASAKFTCDDNGNFFAAGYYAPAYFAVDKNGNTIVRLEDTLADMPESESGSMFWYPKEMKYENKAVLMKFETSDGIVAVDPLTGKVLSVTYPEVDTSVLNGTWEAYLCEIEGMEWTPKEQGASITVTIKDGKTMDFVYKAAISKNSKTFKDVAFKVVHSAMYFSIESYQGQNWHIDAEKDKLNTITFQQTGPNEAEAFWYQGAFSEESVPAVLWIKLQRK